MKRLNTKTVYEGQWLSVEESLYINKDGQEYIWETVRRNKEKATVGVVILARLVPSQRFILIKQFRPAIDGYLISLPAGLGFDDPEHALVELKQETGYTGHITRISPVLKTGASLVDDSARIINIDVDEHLPANQNPVQDLEPAEDIEVCLVSREEGLALITKEQNKGVHIAANLWYIFGLTNL